MSKQRTIKFLLRFLAYCKDMRGAIALTVGVGIIITLTAIAEAAPERQDPTSSFTEASEYQIKAVYLYQFIVFSQWPQDTEKNEQSTLPSNQSTESDLDKVQNRMSDEKTDDVIRMCILGNDPFNNYFSKVEGRVVRGKEKRLVIERLDRYREGLDLSRFDVLFICKSEKDRCQQILKTIEDLSILTVADCPDFLKAGGMINLMVLDEKVRWEINLTPLKRAKIRLDSQLLRIAIRVIETSDEDSKNGFTGKR